MRTTIRHGFSGIGSGQSGQAQETRRAEAKENENERAIRMWSAAAKPEQGVGPRATGLIGSGRAPENTMAEEGKILAIRPCRESKTGWTREPGDRLERTRVLWKLNERGPELNVFWILKIR